MGDIVSGLFGGSSSGQSSSNQAYPFLQQQLGGVVGNASTGSNALSALLGVGGDPDAQNAAFNNYKNSTGYNFTLGQGSNAITGNAASRGLLNSGSTGKALENYGQGLAGTTFNNYLSQLLGYTNTGLQAGQNLAQAGTQSQSDSSSSSGGLGKFLGSALSTGATLFSDIRLKKNVSRVGTTEYGLPIYEYDYTFKPGRHVGVMAQDIEELFPEALGPVIDGYMTVDYSKVK